MHVPFFIMSFLFVLCVSWGAVSAALWLCADLKTHFSFFQIYFLCLLVFDSDLMLEGNVFPPQEKSGETLTGSFLFVWHKLIKKKHQMGNDGIASCRTRVHWTLPGCYCCHWEDDLVSDLVIGSLILLRRSLHKSMSTPPQLYIPH